MGLDTKYNIKDKDLQKVVQQLEKKADAGSAGNFEINPKGITKEDTGKMTEGRRYVDTANKRIVFKIDGKLYGSDLDEI